MTLFSEREGGEVMKIVFLLIVIIIMACSFGIGYARGTANGRVIVKIELDPETLNSALSYHGITYCSFDGTFYFMREFQLGVIKFVTFNKSLNETQLRVVAK